MKRRYENVILTTAIKIDGLEVMSFNGYLQIDREAKLSAAHVKGCALQLNQ